MRLRPLVCFCSLLFAPIAACGGSKDTVLTVPAAAGAAGAGGGTAGAGGGAGKAIAGSGGATSGSGGKAAAGGSATAGGAGATAGGGGGATAGSAGATAGGGGSAPCKSASDCAGPLPIALPAGCAEWTCEAATGACALRAKDKDADGHRGAACKATDGTPILTGDDCDDNDKDAYPGAWDGPADGARPDRCDGRDQDCSGDADQAKASDGKSCFCNPGDTLTCGEDPGGKAISFPKLDAAGKPVGACRLGKKTCGSDGKYGPCSGAVAPEPVDRCIGKDENCNGLVDMADTVPPLNQITFTFDGDDDNQADASHPGEAKTTSCAGAPPATCPAYLDTAKHPCNPAKQWKTVALPLKDCNDNDPNVFYGAQEFCNGADDDCNGTVDDSYASDVKTWSFDYDNDDYGDVTVKPIKSCGKPTTVPPGCADLAAGAPAGYCAGLPEEALQPECPIPACDPATMWKENLPATDCKDRPDQNPGGGLNPYLVHPGGTDRCNSRDYDCDGTANTGCSCAPVGLQIDCGAASSCNVGKQTCGAGGVFGACSGGDPKPRGDYCPDGDSDGFCDLSRCELDLCPADVKAGFKLKSLCFSQTDCDDTDPAFHPSGGETCNGDGKDYNCNNIPNTPGAGDCACVGGATNLACAPGGLFYPASYKPGDAFPPGAVCQWGTQSCNPDGTLTPCLGGTGAFLVEQCNKDGKDYNCNGKPNTDAAECSCSTTDPPKSCEDPNKCNKGCTQACLNGTWGPESKNPVAKLTDCYADKDHDGVCAGGTLSKCPPGSWGNDAEVECSTDCAANDTSRNYRNGRNCYGGNPLFGNGDCNDGAAGVRRYFAEAASMACGAGSTSGWTVITSGGPPRELCGDGVDSDCTGGDSNGYDVGAACDNGLKGSCYKTGAKVCAAAGSSTTACGAGAWPDCASGKCGTWTTTTVHGSYDVSCDGLVQYQNEANSTGLTTYLASQSTTCTSSNAGYDCAQASAANGGTKQPIMVFVPCASHIIGTTGGLPDSVPSGYAFRQNTVPNCGSNVGQNLCLWDGAQWSLGGVTLAYVQKCQ